MIPKIKKILFVTDLSENAWTSFEYAVSLATGYQAKLSILHVLPNALPLGYRPMVEGLVGEEFNKQKQQRMDAARNKLIGKEKEAHKIQHAVVKWFEDMISNAEELDFKPIIEETLVKEGEYIEEEVVLEAKALNCDLILVGANHSDLLPKGSKGNRLLRIIRDSKLPVFIAPGKK